MHNACAFTHPSRLESSQLVCVLYCSMADIFIDRVSYSWVSRGASVLSRMGESTGVNAPRALTHVQLPPKALHVLCIHLLSE